MKSSFYRNRASWNDIRKYIFDCCEKNKDHDFFVFFKDREKCSVTYGQALCNLKRIGSRVLSKNNGVPRVSLLGGTSPEWIFSYLAMLCYGIVVTPLDKSLSKEEIYRQFAFSDSNLLLFDSYYKDVAAFILDRSPDAACIPLDCPVPGYGESVSEWIASDLPVVLPPELDEKSLCEIVYTSGTTGESKGVMLSNENIVSTVMAGIRLVDMKPGDAVLSILPNNHTYELAVGILTPMYFGMALILNNTLKTLKKNMQAFRPTTMLVVPALLGMMQREILREIKKNGKKEKFDRLVSLTRAAKRVGIDLRRKAFRPILDYFGGELKSLICGGAFLPQSLIDFYENLGIHIIQGYGITECSPIVSCNTDRSSRALGEVVPSCRVTCMNGEICVSGKNVMLGYYKDPEATQKAIVDGWFHTGDIGSLDRYNCLSLDGRKDHIIINSNGENISPEAVEEVLQRCEIVSDCMVYSEDDLIAVSVYPDSKYLAANHIENVEEAVRAAIEEANKDLPPKMRAERVHLRSTPFEVTTTLKKKRPQNAKDSAKGAES